jgi:hypothetical protein
MRNVVGNICRENQNTHFIFNNIFPKILPFMRQCGVRWSSLQATGNVIIGRRRNACWINNAADTHSAYEIYLAFSLQQWLGERVSILRHTCLVLFIVDRWNSWQHMLLVVRERDVNCVMVCSVVWGSQLPFHSSLSIKNLGSF